MSDTAAATTDLKHKTVFSVLWSVLRVAFSTVATFVIFLVLARVLGPAEFGTFALASLFTEVGRIIAFGGFGDAVTRQYALDEELADTAFWALVVFSIAMGIGIYAAAPFYAGAVRDPAVEPILKWLAFLIPLGSLAVIHNARLARDFRHRNLAAQSMAASLLSGGAAIAAALSGFGVYALVVQAGVQAVVTVALGWIFFPWMPRLRFDMARFRGVLGFSLSLMVSQLLWMLLTRVQDIFISRWYGAAEVGRYRVAWRLIELIGQAVLAPIGSVSLVTLSRLQNDPQALRNAYNRIVGAAALGTFPLLLGFGALSEETIHLLFGSQWQDTGPIASVLVLMAVPFVMNVFAAPALAAVDKAHTIMSVAALQLAATLLLTWLLVPYGVVWVAAGYTLRAWLTMPYQQYLLSRHVGIAPMGTIRAVALPLAGSVLMAATVWLSKAEIASLVTSPFVALALNVALGGVVYAAFLAVFGRRTLKPYTDMAAAMLARRRRPATGDA
ncbi:lipopolysaccharide biosynthesis protein [Aureimonas frigidaquae]|uniref:Putative polysaccharide biosynthesis protein n=1 Tax=Aureimonas frigidaquae TaxID=424757 RepID=A0A0P0Z0D8_9HYPH|nr:lipopolysaccharide biosynthesis protein [Aureimonas frigidaquae]BAT27344.1 putative polysaccharide biosynthesis protein [Aureimonas frigidaquae]